MLFYLFMIFIAEVFSYSFIVAIDVFARKKRWKIIPIKFSMIKSPLCEKNTISVISLILLIINMCYLILALACAILDSFVYSHRFFVIFAGLGSMCNAIVSFCALIILGVIYVVMVLKKNI